MYSRVDDRHSTASSFESIQIAHDQEPEELQDPVRSNCTRKALVFLGIFFLMIALATVSIFVYHFSHHPSDGTTTPQPWTNALYTIAVIGDWGRDGKFGQQETANAMANVCKQLGCQRVVTTGDNFYPAGVTSPDAAQFGTSFRQIYTAPSLKIPWNPTLGNHDYGYPAAEVAYTYHAANLAAEEGGRWQMPAQFYNISLSLPTSSSRPLHLIMLDTSPMIQLYYNDSHTNYTALLAQNVTQQLEFLRQQLCQNQPTNSSDPWKIVFSHHPIYSAQDEAWSGYSDLRRLLLPLFQACPPQLFVSGHAHMLQSIAFANQKTAHIISGAGSQLWPEYDASFAGLDFAAAVNGFVILQVADTATQVLYYDNQSNILFGKTVKL
eukprot:TRINITY_DN3076_c0_g1_i2.p1 TRINITY_DN3076_c0_g1~~TRINITY_DN3076_c0_g1_i2.p1  ORF type:complete len:410 (+),score=98.48 TRINITY_DN3076_c0_g1_i2:91-1230(+)